MPFQKKIMKKRLGLMGGVMTFLGLSLSLISQSQTIQATKLNLPHIGTFDGQTTFQLDSESGILPTLELEVENNKGEIETYKTSQKELVVSDTMEGSTIKRAVLKGKTLTNLVNQATYELTYDPVDEGKYIVNSEKNKVLITFNETSTEWRYVLIPAKLDLLKPNTQYFLTFEGNYEGSISIKNKEGKLVLAESVKVRDGVKEAILTVNDLSVGVKDQGVYFNPREPKTFPYTYELANVMLVELVDGVETWDVPYFETTQSVVAPTLIVTGENEGEMNRLAFGEDLILRSNGEIYDELDLLTGELIRRIGEDGEVLDEEIIEIIELRPHSQIQITGRIDPVVISATVPSEELSFTLDPNQEVGHQFIAPEFEVTNNSNVPLTLTLKTFEQTSTIFNDVLPETHESWEGLSKKESKDFALGLVSKPSDHWLSRMEKTHYVSNTNNELIGTIKPKGNVTFGFVAHHGQSFSELLTPSYRMTFVFDLLN